MRLKTTEAAVLRGCLKLLQLRGVLAWRNNSGTLRDRTGRPVSFGKVGSSDILGVLDGRFGASGRILCVECKRPGNKPTEAQEAFLAAVRRAGGVALVIDDPGVLAAWLDGATRGAKPA